jgi:acyl phosphate:glycerol-3-phosphate acyltransferase
MLTDIIIIITAYLLGSIASAVIVCKLMGYADPRTLGSGNPGATNVLRYGGKLAAIITLLFDILKGVLAVGLANIWAGSDLIIAAAALAVFLGHLYPLFFNFKGGKGVATGLGILLALNWIVGLMAMGTWLIIAIIFRYSSLAALVTALLAPGYILWHTVSMEYTIIVVIITILIFWRHRSNISQLWAGNEAKLFNSK